MSPCAPTHINFCYTKLDLTDQRSLSRFFATEKVNQVYLEATKVSGIHANNFYPAEPIYQNLIMEANIFHDSWLTGVRKMLFLGSSCIYPSLAPQPMAGNVLLTGSLMPTYEPCDIAKIAIV